MSGAPSSALRKGEETRREMRRPVKLTFIRLVPETPPARLLRHPLPSVFPCTVAGVAGAIKTYHRMKKSTLLLKRFDFISRVMHTAAIHPSSPALLGGLPITKAFVAQHRPGLGCNWEFELQTPAEPRAHSRAVPVGCFSPAAALHLSHAGASKRAFV